jgi:hypothetical protein
LYDCIKYVGLDADEEVLAVCKSAFDVLCSKLEEKLAFAPDEQVTTLGFIWVARHWAISGQYLNSACLTGYGASSSRNQGKFQGWKTF